MPRLGPRLYWAALYCYPVGGMLQLDSSYDSQKASIQTAIASRRRPIRYIISDKSRCGHKLCAKKESIGTGIQITKRNCCRMAPRSLVSDAAI